MRTYEKNIENRKELVKRLEELTGLKATYTFMPRCAYEIGAFTVEKDGSLTVADEADETILETLKAEGMVKAGDEEETATEEDSVQPLEEYPDTEEAETAGETETAEEAEEEADPENAFPIDTTVSFPISQHTSTSLINLVSTIYSRGPILSKATGGEFAAERELVEALQNAKLYTVQSVLDFLAEWDGSEKPLTGIEFSDDEVTFTGFTGVQDAEHVRTFTRLAAVMNKSAITPEAGPCQGDGHDQ